MQGSPNQDFYTRAKQKIEEAKDVLILLPFSNAPDAVAAGLALYSAIKQKHTEANAQQLTKNVTISSASPLSEELKKLPNSKAVQQSVGTKNLVITLNANVENIEKVTTDDDQGKFNIVIETKNITEKLGQEDVHVSYRGVSADLIIIVGAFNQSQLGDLLIQEPKLLEGREIITFTHQFGAVPFGSINISDPQASGSSEMVSTLFRYYKIKPTPEVTTNLLAGVESATNNFSHKTTAETFSLAGWCLRNGAQRNLLTGSQLAPSPFAPRPFSPTPSPFPTNPFGNFPRPPMPGGFDQPQPFPAHQAAFPPSPFQAPIPSPFPPAPFQPIAMPTPPVPFMQPQTNIPSTDNAEDAIEGVEEDQQQTKKDWYEPKIYRGGQNV